MTCVLNIPVEFSFRFFDKHKIELYGSKHEHASPVCPGTAPGPSPSSLPLVVHEVELVDEPDQVVAALVDGPHQGHEGHVVALGVELGVEPRSAGGLHHHRQPVGQGLGLSQDLVVVGKLAGLDGLDVVEDQADPGGQHLDGAVLGQEVLRHPGDLGLGVAGHRGDSGHVVESNSLGLLQKQCQ